MKKNITRQINVLAAIIITITINVLANALPLNNLNTGEISDRFEVFFVPAGYVFSIWGLIYLGLIAFGIYQALPAQRDNPRLQKIGWLFVLSSLANVIWLFLWHFEQFYFTLFAMLAILISLLMIYTRLETGKIQVSTGEKWFVRIPFSIYLGWISVATIANATQFLYYLNWNGWGISAAVWPAIMLVIAAILGISMSILRQDRAYTLVLIWVFIGIALKHAGVALVASTASVSVVALGLLVVLTLVRKEKT